MQRNRPPELDERADDDEYRGCSRKQRCPTDLDQQAQGVATRSAAMMSKGHYPHPSPQSAMNGTVVVLPNIAAFGPTTVNPQTCMFMMSL